MPSNDNTTSIKYLNTSRDNYLKWKRHIDATLSKHQDKLLTVVQNQTLSITVQLKVHQMAESAKEDPAATIKKYLQDLDTTAYFIIIESIGCNTTLQTIDRKFGKTNDAHATYNYIADRWDLNKADSDEHLVGKDDERIDFVREGPQSGSLTHVTDFVEEMLARNIEFEGTVFHWSDTLLVTRLLTAVAKHERALVDAFRGSRTGTDWKKDFDKVWEALKKHLATKSGEQEREPTRNSDTLVTSNNEQFAAMMETITTLTTEVNRLKNRRGPSAYSKQCDHCGGVHVPQPQYGCIGKAVAEGTITAQVAEAKFSFAKDPHALVNSAVDKYKRYQASKNGPATAPKEPEVKLATRINPPKTHMTHLGGHEQPGGGRDSKHYCITTRQAATPAPPPDPHAAIGDRNIPWPHELPLHDRLSGVSDRPGHMSYPATDRLSWAPPSGHTNYHSGLPSGLRGIHGEPRSTEVGGPTPVSHAQAPTSGAPSSSSTLATPTTRGDPPLPIKFDTQAEDTILTDPRFFLNGVDNTQILSLSTIVPQGGALPVTEGVGTAYISTADGTMLCIHGAHLYSRGLHNVVATRKIDREAHVDTERHCLTLRSTGVSLPFDAGYCAMYVRPLAPEWFDQVASVTLYTGHGDIPALPEATPRHPDAAEAILTTSSRCTDILLSHFGGITKGPRTDAGLHSLTAEQLGALYHRRTGLESRALKSLPDVTDAPDRLRSVPRDPVNDPDTMMSNMPKQPAKASHPPTRSHVVCFDLEGPHPPSKHGGNRYSVNFVYLHTAADGSVEHRDWTLDYLPSKDKFPDLLAHIIDTTDFPWKRCQLYTDNEIVLNSKAVKDVVRARKLLPVRNSCEYEPWQNGAVERPWRTLASSARTFILRGFGAGDAADRSDGVDPDGYWTYAYEQRANVHAATHASDRKGHIKHLRVPFCLAYVKVPQRYLSNKLAPQAEKCIHLGWSRQKPGYVFEVLEGPRAGKLVVSTQAKFREDVFPLHAQHATAPTAHDSPTFLWHDIEYEPFDDFDPPPRPPNDDTLDPADDTSDADDDDAAPSPPPSDDSDASDPPDAPPRHRHATRQTTDLGDWRPIVRQLDANLKAHTATLSTSGAPVSYVPKRFSDIAKIDDIEERNQWYRAHYAENDGLMDKPDVLNVIEKPDSVSESDLFYLNTLYTKKNDGRYKARTVLSAGKGALDQLDIGYERTYSPTARESTFRLLCNIAAIERMTIRGGDVKQAYAQAHWPQQLKKVLSRLPSGYKMYFDGKTHCCEVGNLYGHVIAGKNWYQTLVAWLLAYGFTQSEWDPCYFYIVDGDGHRMHFLVYVDDVLTFTASDDLYQRFASAFSADFDWTSYGSDLHDYVSIRIRQRPGEVSLDMEEYIDRCVADAFPGGVHHAYSVPAEGDLPQVVRKAAAAKDTAYAKSSVGTRYRRILMRCLYVARQTRPDICAAVNYLSRVQAYPSPDLLKRVERVLIYLWGTKSMALTYSSAPDTNLQFVWAPRAVVHGRSDANFEVGHSTSGYVFILTAAVSWATKKQDSVALHTQHAEINAGSLAACEAVCLRGLLAEAGHPQRYPTLLLMDNSSSIDLAFDPVLHAKTKHIERRDLFIRELVSRDVVKPRYVSTANNTADVLTKPLTRQAFIRHRATMLGLSA